MIRVFCLGAFFLCGSVTTALASGAVYIRHPTSSSIPCAGGSLTEVRSESGNVYSATGSLFLVCQDSLDHAKWIVESSVACSVNSDESENADPACGSQAAEPIGKFATQPPNEPRVNVYLLGRYVFASDCRIAHTIYKSMEALSNKVEYSSEQDGWVCRQVNKVNSLKPSDAEGKDIGHKTFRYARIVERGPEEHQDDGSTPEIGQSILGVNPMDTDYTVSFEHGRLDVR